MRNKGTAGPALPGSDQSQRPITLNRIKYFIGVCLHQMQGEIYQRPELQICETSLSCKNMVWFTVTYLHTISIISSISNIYPIFTEGVVLGNKFYSAPLHLRRFHLGSHCLFCICENHHSIQIGRYISILKDQFLSSLATLQIEHEILRFFIFYTGRFLASSQVQPLFFAIWALGFL